MLLKVPGMDRCQNVNDLTEAWKFRLITKKKKKKSVYSSLTSYIYFYSLDIFRPVIKYI